MGIRHDLQDNILDNPIAWREFITLFRQRSKWFWRGLYAVTGLLFILPVLFSGHRYFNDVLSFIVGLLFFANIFIYPLVVVRSIGTANESIARERRGKTWDLLMLTGVSTWRVVVGKWLGTMRFIIRDYVWLLLLRFGAFFWYAAQQSFYRDYNYNMRSELTLADIHIHWQPFFVALLWILAFTVAEMLFSSALGVATAFFNWRTRTASGVAIGVRIGLAIAVFVGTMYAVGYIRFNFNEPAPDYEEHVDHFILTFAITLADNGMLSSGHIATERYLDEQDIDAIRLALALHLLLYLVLTGIALEVARTVSYRIGVNDPDPVRSKSKRKNDIAAAKPVSESPQRTIAIPAGAGNIFALAAPADYRAEVYHYQQRLGRMYLRLTKDSTPTYVQLSNVTYIEAPSVWSGAEFRTATQSEYDAFVQEKGLKINQFASNSMRLYIMDGEQPIRIVAGTAQMIDEMPMEI